MTAGAPILQSSTVTPGHAFAWVTDGIGGDAGPATSSSLTSVGATNNGGIGLGINSGPTSAAYVQLGFAVANNGTATIYLNGFGGAPSAQLNYNINGVTYAFNPSASGNVTGPVSSVSGDIVTFNGTSGAIIRDSGVQISELLVGPTVAVSGHLAAFNGTSGGVIEDSGYAVSTFMQGVISQTSATAAAGALSVLSLINGGTVAGPVVFNGAPTAIVVGAGDLVIIDGALSASTISSSAAITAGVDGAATGLLELASGAPGGAVAIVQNPSATTAYNFNLPTDAGTTGQVLTSAGGVNAPMTWSSAAGGVTSFNTRTGAVTLTTADWTGAMPTSFGSVGTYAFAQYHVAATPTAGTTYAGSTLYNAATGSSYSLTGTWRCMGPENAYSAPCCVPAYSKALFLRVS